MFFSIVERGTNLTPANYPKAYLISDSWDDFSFRTLFRLVVFDSRHNRHTVGSVKIGQFGLTKVLHSPRVPEEFDTLDTDFFSLGQSDNYYETLRQFGSQLRLQILRGLRDVVADLPLFERALDEPVMQQSLLRTVSPMLVRTQFKRILDGGERHVEYRFAYHLPPEPKKGAPGLNLSFEVEPESTPPTNVHVLIGRNGAGKTFILDGMARALLDEPKLPGKVGTFASLDSQGVLGGTLFANIVSVSFSAFDEFEPLPERRDATAGLKYSYVGLKRQTDRESEATQRTTNKKLDNFSAKTPRMLGNEFSKSLLACLTGSKKEQWLSTIRMLESDPVFRGMELLADIPDVLERDPSDIGAIYNTIKSRSWQSFRALSSGHKIVLLTITRLVETVDERTLVLLDEPECHLHPPLLSAFVRALSQLLVERNGVAIIATHSPVVLQEVPKRCVWKLRRTGNVSVAERPQIETFGENVGVLTREAFGLEVTESGFHKLIQTAIHEDQSYEGVLRQFDNQLGAEARAIIRSLIATRNHEQGW